MRDGDQYKDTLNLPKTSFPMKANLAQREQKWVKSWQESNLYQQAEAQLESAPQFILQDGPPYANGDIHIGHAVNKILKDIILRSKRLSGQRAPYIPGWDCHGLPIEQKVEQKKGKVGNKINAHDFRVACRKYAATQVEKQKAGFVRLGILGDWDNPYLTMDYDYEANTQKQFAEILKAGHVEKGFKPVHWCLDCSSSLAEAEVEYHSKVSPSIDVLFPAVESGTLAKLFGLSESPTEQIGTVIWTTTPWTLPANQAVCLHPEIDYVFATLTRSDQPDCTVLVADGLLEAFCARIGATVSQHHGTLSGQDLTGLAFQHPFEPRTVPVVLGEHVTLESGTGVVHTAPAHGPDDFVIGKQYNLPLDNPVGADGKYVPETPVLAGIHVTKANEQILSMLSESGLLLQHSKLEHSYPHCWRHKSPIIFRLTPQWFISMDKNGLRQKALSAIKEAQWIPAWGDARITGMIEGRPDWCVSRQRYWGVPIPLIVHRDTGDIHPEMESLLDTILPIIKSGGVDAWFDLDIATVLSADHESYIKVNDTLDVWFDSGVVHACVGEQRPELSVPADLYIEGSDQYRGWFHSSLLTHVATQGTAPYRQVLTHGFVVDADGKKMSKSLGNTVSPDEVCKTLGADILRLWVSATDYKVEMNISTEILKRTSDAYRRIRNTLRFLLANLAGFDFAQHACPTNELLAMDAWIIDATQSLQAEVMDAYDNYDFHHIYQKIHNFCIVQLGGFYLDVIKDRQYTTQADSLARRSAQTALYHIVQALVRWLSPILCFTAEEIWEQLGSDVPFVALSTWYTEFPVIEKESQLIDWQSVMAVRTEVNKVMESLRQENKLGSSLEADVTLYVDDTLFNNLNHLEDELRFVLITSYAKLKPLEESPNDAQKTELEGLSLAVEPVSYTKCVRCWHRREDVGTHTEHPSLCERCVTNVEGDGEARAYA